MRAILTILSLAVVAYFAYDVYDFYFSATSEKALLQGEVDTLELQARTKKAKLLEAEDFAKNLNDKRNQVRALSEKLSAMRATLTENLDLPNFMNLLVSEAQRIGILINSLTPATANKKDYYVEQPFEVSFSGLYVQLLAFLDRLSQAEKIIRVDEFTIAPRGQNSLKSRFVELGGTLKIKTYLYLGSREDELVKDPDNAAAKAAGKTAPAAKGAVK